MTILAVQYLESSPGTSQEDQEKVRTKLRAALDLLPIKLLLIGWEAPAQLIHICREETDRVGAKLYRWHPFLTGDGDFVPKPEWQTVGLQGQKVPGFRNMPEFTFVCPNRPAVQAALTSHLQKILRSGHYDGIFLDRMRFPSPAANPAAWLACFCEECYQAAAQIGLDLTAVREAFQRLVNSPDQLPDLITTMFRNTEANTSNPDLLLLNRFLRFRAASITSIVSRAADLIYDQGLEVGLDTFSPSLTRLVGQDLQALDPSCEWIKVMTYGHTMGPSGLPFELIDLANWLITDCSLSEQHALDLLSTALQHPLPRSMGALRDRGVLPEVLKEEVERGRSLGVSCLLAGIELVELASVTYLTESQIQADLQAFHKADAGGFVFSWDLQLMPLDRLAQVARILRSHQ